jgi:hypothetical protein
MKQQESKFNEFQELLSKSKENPLALLEKAGISYQDLTQYILSMDEPTKVDPLDEIKQELSSLKKEKEEEKLALQRQVEEKEISQVQTLVSKYQSEMVNMLQSDTDKYELINTYGDAGYSLVWDVVEEYWNQNKEILDPQVAAEQVEDFLLAESSKLISAKKLFKGQKSVPEEVSNDTSKVTRDIKNSTKTLTNKAATRSSIGERVIRTTDLDEKIKRAASLLK